MNIVIRALHGKTTLGQVSFGRHTSAGGRFRPRLNRLATSVKETRVCKMCGDTFLAGQNTRRGTFSPDFEVQQLLHDCLSRRSHLSIVSGQMAFTQCRGMRTNKPPIEAALCLVPCSIRDQHKVGTVAGAVIP